MVLDLPGVKCTTFHSINGSEEGKKIKSYKIKPLEEMPITVQRSNSAL